MAPHFVHMLPEREGISTAHYLLHTVTPSEGYTALWERGYLHLTLEAIIVENAKRRILFSEEELDRAGKHLISYGYKQGTIVHT